MSNVADLEFNLFEVHRLGDYQPRADLDSETPREILRAVDRVARGAWAESLIESDRSTLELQNGEVALPLLLKPALRELRDGGWDRVGLPTEMGGVPVPHLLFWAFQELLLGANTPATFYAGGPLFARVIFEEGTSKQRSLARLMIERGWAGTMHSPSPTPGPMSAPAPPKQFMLQVTYTHLTGVKRFITGGEHDGSENIIHLVLARTAGAVSGTKGLSHFIVPKWLFDEEGNLGSRNGILATRLEHKMGLKGSTTCEMTLGADHPCVGYLVGGRHDGIRQMFRVIEHARMTIGTKAAATLSTGYLNSLTYARGRVQGPDLTRMADKIAPRVRLIDHPDVRRMLMLQKAHAEGLRALWTYTAWVRDQAELDPAWSARAGFLLPLVKGYSAEKAHELLATSLQVLGGSGYTEDYPLEQYLRDAKFDSIYEGTTGIQALDLFFRKVVRDQGQTIAQLAAEILDYVKVGEPEDPFADERELLGKMVDDAQAHLGAAVGYLFEAQSDPPAVYKAGLHLNPLLESIAETVIAWQLVRHGEIASQAPAIDLFRLGKVESARYFIRHVAPKVAARRSATESEDGSLMRIPDESW